MKDAIYIDLTFLNSKNVDENGAIVDEESRSNYFQLLENVDTALRQLSDYKVASVRLYRDSDDKFRICYNTTRTETLKFLPNLHWFWVEGEVVKTFPHRIIEVDPHGKQPNESGAKLDAGKSQPSLVLGDMHEALKAVIEVSDYGAKKYTKKGWINVPDGESRYTEAMLRHYLAEQTEDCDVDSGLLHAAHLAWNALTRLHFIIERKRNEKE